MHQFNASSIASSLAADFNAGSLVAPVDVADVLAYLNDSPDHHIDDYAPGWDAEEYIPSEADLAEYAAWSRAMNGGCRVDELSPDEMALYAFSATESEYWEAVAAEYDAARDCEEAFIGW